MSNNLGQPLQQLRDGEDNSVEYDIAYPVKVDLPAAIEQIRELHGDEVYLLPISGCSTGGGILQSREKPPGKIVGLAFVPPVKPRVRHAAQVELYDIDLDEIVIDSERQQIAAGASITLHQLNQALAQELGHSFKVPGADLTSYMYAAVGATFMTGGMGPQRRYFSDSVIEISLFDGHHLTPVTGEELQGYAGTYGWSGIVAALRCRYCQFPGNEIAFALPVTDNSQQLARLLKHLSPYSYLNLDTAPVSNAIQGHDLILGIEHVSRGSLQPLLNFATEHPTHKRASELEQKCVAAAADGLVFISGFSARSSDEFLLGLADDSQAEEYTIAGIGLDFAEVFSDPEEMRAVREAIPYIARTVAPSGLRVYKNHSDANISLAAGEVESVFAELWQINLDYVASVENHFAENDNIDGQILVYGHLNPYGVDPHNRVTMSSNDDDAFAHSRRYLVEQRARYYRALAELCATSNAVFVGGEKTADSEIGIFRALGGPEFSPVALYERFKRQRVTVQAAAKSCNWRALEPYR